MAEREMRLRQEMEYQRFNERFWGEFFSANPELQMFQGEVGRVPADGPERRLQRACELRPRRGATEDSGCAGGREDGS